MKRIIRVAMRVAPVGAITLVVTGCIEEANTPSALLPNAQPVPEGQPFVLPARDEAISEWQLPAASPWAPYEKYTLLTALDTHRVQEPVPQVGELDVVRSAIRAGAAVGGSGMPNDAMWIVDLRGAASVGFGYGLSAAAKEPIALVPTFNNWPAENEMIPAEETLAAMVEMPPRVPPSGDANARPVFLLDAWRLAYKEEDVDEGVTDNRYMLSPADFPSAETLHARGIARIIYVVESRGDDVHEEDDLNELFLAYEAAGIEVDIVDLDWLQGIPTRVVHYGVRVGYPYYGWWWWGLGTYRFTCVHRWTVVHDARFYMRARGGFGGVHGVPHYGGGHFHFSHGGGGFGGHGFGG
jgi:hypothetical protein